MEFHKAEVTAVKMSVIEAKRNATARAMNGGARRVGWRTLEVESPVTDCKEERPAGREED